MMRKTLYTLALLLFASSSAFAQQGQGRRAMSPEQMRERHDVQVKEMATALELSEEQTPLFLEVMEAQFADRMDLMEDMQAGNRGNMREKMEALQATTEKVLAGFLNETQMEKYKEILASRRGRRGPAST